MANKMSKEHVAELLKQLEELKRKKAYKERKLQKLKNCNIKDIRKGQVSIKKTSDSGINNGTSLKGTSANLLQLDKSSKQSNSPIKKSHSVDLKDSKDNSTLKLDHENYDSKSFNSDFIDTVDQSVQNYSDREMQKTKILYNQEEQTDKISNHVVSDITKCNSVQKDECKSYNLPTLKRDLSEYNAIHGVKDVFLSKKHKSSVCGDDDDNFKFNDENCYSNVQTSNDIEEYVCDGKAMKSPACDMKRNDEILELNVDPKTVIVPELCIDNNLNSSHYDQKSSDNSSKSILNDKGQSSDLLDDSLNANMSCFLSPDLFDNNNVDKKELDNNVNDDTSTSLKISECPISTENVSFVFNQKTSSPVRSNIPLNAIQKNTFDFSFPKFSTPTDVNFVISGKEENMQGSLAQKEVQKTCKFVEEVSDLNENIHLLDEDRKHCISPQKFSPSKIDCILGKGLSSVLDAQFESPKKLMSENKNLISVKSRVHSPDLADETVFKKERLFQTTSFVTSETEQNAVEHEEIRPLSQKLNNSKENSHSGRQISDADLDFCNGFPSNSGSFSDLQDTSALANDSDEVPSQVTKTVDGLVNKVCEDCSEQKKVISEQDLHFISMKNDDLNNDNHKPDSEILIVPETEGLGFYFSKDTDEFLETSTLSQNMEEFHENEALLNLSSQSKLASPVVNNIVASVKLARTLDECHTCDGIHNEKNNYVNLVGKSPEKEQMPADNISAFDNTLGLDTSFLEEDTQTLGNFKQVPYMNEINVQEKSGESNVEIESNLSFVCSLYGEEKEPVLNVEIVIFGGVKYAFIQQARQMHIWRQEKNVGWIKIFSHRIEDMLLLVQISVTMDEDNLVIVMLLSGEEKYCLQFLLFEKGTKVIKLMENTHWLENSDFKGSILLCGLNGLMFATAQNKENPEISLHAFISLKENPRLMTAVLGSTDNKLCSLCKIDKLPNALMGISDTMLYVWHILEARLVTAVTLHPLEYLRIKECFWATVENGLVYFLTTCESEKNDQVCQLLAANLATGFCQRAMTYSTRPSNHEIGKINKAVYLEPYLVVSHSSGAFLWSVTDEFCCAALHSKSNITTTAISRDFENWGLLALGSKTGYINCYSLN